MVPTVAARRQPVSSGAFAAAVSILGVLTSTAGSSLGATAREAPSGSTPADTFLARNLATRIFPVYGERGFGAGFLCDAAGLVLTDLRVSDGSFAPRVQISADGSVAARVLVQSPERGIAVLCVNPAVLAGRTPLPLAQPAPGEPLASAGDRVLAIGASLMGVPAPMQGVVRRADARRIDVAFAPRPGAAGAPVLSLNGEVIAILRSTGTDATSPVRVVPIVDALPLLAAAAESLGASPGYPSPDLLPSVPRDYYPAAALRTRDDRLSAGLSEYLIEIPGYLVALLTPPVCAYMQDRGPPNADPWFLWGALEGRYPPVVALHVEPSKSTPSLLWPVVMVARVGRGTARVFGSVAGTISDGITGHGSEREGIRKKRSDFCDLELLRDGVAVEPLVRQCSDHAYDRKKSTFVTRKGCKGAFFYYSRQAFEPAVGRWPSIDLRLFDPSKLDEPARVRLSKKTLELVASDLEAVHADRLIPTTVPEATLPSEGVSPAAPSIGDGGKFQVQLARGSVMRATGVQAWGSDQVKIVLATGETVFVPKRDVRSILGEDGTDWTRRVVAERRAAPSNTR
jgi:hypothetical protein